MEWITGICTGGCFTSLWGLYKLTKAEEGKNWCLRVAQLQIFAHKKTTKWSKKDARCDTKQAQFLRDTVIISSLLELNLQPVSHNIYDQSRFDPNPPTSVWSTPRHSDGETPFSLIIHWASLFIHPRGTFGYLIANSKLWLQHKERQSWVNIQYTPTTIYCWLVVPPDSVRQTWQLAHTHGLRAATPRYRQANGGGMCPLSVKLWL